MASRVLVHLGSNVAKFPDCVLNALNPAAVAAGSLQVPTNFRLDGEKLHLWSDPDDGHMLAHPPECPMMDLTRQPEDEREEIPEDIAGRGVAVGAVALLESSDGRVLLTRRAQHMRTFPGVWVPPGGGVEPGETDLVTAAIRELEEETGIRLSKHETVSKPFVLGLWESVYPPFLNWGSPRRHHVVVYFAVPVSATSKELDSRIKLQPEEVDASAWLTQEHAKVTAWGEEAVGDAAKLDMIVLEGGKKQKTVTVSGAVLAAKAPGAIQSAVDVERISSGTRFALSQWLKTKTSARNGVKL